MKSRLVLASALGVLVCFAACGESADIEPTGPGSTSSSSGSSGMTTSSSSSSSSSSGGVADAGPPDAMTDSAPVDAGLSMSFFVTSTGSVAQGGNLGGLAGADMKCQTLAQAVGAGGKTWKAYLSITGTNASSRIGTGPWYNQKLKMIAPNVAMLHANNIAAADVVDENGVVVPANVHDILTGTNADGTANANTCNGWTSNAAAGVMRHVGHSDSNGMGTNRWNTAHSSQGCSQGQITATAGSGRIYCFAL
jgi:hypothetical protein